MRCLVTGGAGFIGSHIVDRLVEDGHEVIVFDNLSTGKQENINKKAKLFLIDVSNETLFQSDNMEKIMTGVDVIFHLAAFPRVEPSIEQPIHAHNMNVNGTLNMLDVCRRYGVKRFVFTSSSAVYGEAKVPTHEGMETNPMSPYALHKLIGEQYCQLFSKLYDLSTVCLRYSNAYGEGQPTEGAYCNVMGIFEQQKAKGEKLTIVGDGEQRRDFIYVGDIVEANIQTAFYDGPLRGATLNIGSGKNYSVNQIAEWIGGETTNIPPRIEPKETLLDSTQMMECFDWQPTMDLEKWIGDRMKNKKPVTRAQAEARLEYLNTELAHERYWDGWSVQGMKEEKEWLENQLEKLDAK
tara:strand:- start:6816 stop:7871 length:1056 start_codon:yes stop_codon:yes gene_type:complete